MCTDTNCDQLVSMNRDLCTIHQQQMPITPNTANAYINDPSPKYTSFIMLDDHTMIAAEHRPFDVYRVLRYIKCNEHVQDDSTKHQII